MKKKNSLRESLGGRDAMQYGGVFESKMIVEIRGAGNSDLGRVFNGL